MCRHGLLPLLLLSTMAVRITAYSYSEYDFDEMCGGGLSFSHMGAIIIKYDRQSPQTNMNCTVSYSTGGDWRLIARFQTMHLPSSEYCRNAKLDLYDGRLRPEDKLTGSGLCGHTRPQVYTLRSKKIYLQLQTKEWFPGNRFVLYLTDFYPAPCLGDDFMCGNDGCINEMYRCDGWKNCADGSDELDGCDFRYFLTPWVIGVISVGCFFALGLFLAAMTMTVRKLSRRGDYTTITG